MLGIDSKETDDASTRTHTPHPVAPAETSGPTLHGGCTGSKPKVYNPFSSLCHGYVDPSVDPFHVVLNGPSGSMPSGSPTEDHNQARLEVYNPFSSLCHGYVAPFVDPTNMVASMQSLARIYSKPKVYPPCSLCYGYGDASVAPMSMVASTQAIGVVRCAEDSTLEPGSPVASIGTHWTAQSVRNEPYRVELKDESKRESGPETAYKPDFEPEMVRDGADDLAPAGAAVPVDEKHSAAQDPPLVLKLKALRICRKRYIIATLLASFGAIVSLIVNFAIELMGDIYEEFFSAEGKARALRVNNAVFYACTAVICISMLMLNRLHVLKRDLSSPF